MLTISPTLYLAEIHTRDDKHTTLGYLQVLSDQSSSGGANRLFGVGTAENQESAAGYAAVINVNIAVIDGAGLDGSAVITESLDFGATFADNNGFLKGTMLPKQIAGNGHAESSYHQDNCLDGIQICLFVHTVCPPLFQAQHTQHKRNQHDTIYHSVLHILRLEEAADNADQEEQGNGIGANGNSSIHIY